MSNAARHFPLLSNLIAASAVPGEFAGLEIAADQAIARILGELRYHDLIAEKSGDGSSAFYRLKLTAGELELPLFGSALTLVFFPGAVARVSDFAVSLDWRWPVRRYFEGFELQGFSYLPEAFIGILLELANIDGVQELLAAIASTLVSGGGGGGGGGAPYDALFAQLTSDFADLKSRFPAVSIEADNIIAQIATVNGEISVVLAGSDATLLDLIRNYPDYPPIAAAVESAKQSFEYIQQSVSADFDLYESVVKSVFRDVSDLQGRIDSLFGLFQTWLGSITREEVERLLIPHFGLNLNEISMALLVPRSVLIPLDANSEPIADTAQHSRLTFTAGGVSYDSESGFHLDIDSSVPISFTKSMVVGTGVTLEFDDIRVDLSRSTNFAEADAEGRPPDFIGIFVGNAIMGLPKKWFDTHQAVPGTPVTLGIVGRHLLIGTGGISGEIGLEVLQAGKPAPEVNRHEGPEELEFILGKRPSNGPRQGFVLGFSSFGLTFRQNALTESRIKGSLTLPRTQPPEKIGVELFIGGDGDFEVTATDNLGHDFTVPNAFIFQATAVSVGKKGDKVFLRLTGDLDFSNNDILNGLITQPIHLEKLLIHSDGSFEIEGGTVPLPQSVTLDIGPARVAVTALHMGAHEREHGGALRKYRYVGFDGGLSVNPGGIDARGDGVTFYYTVDDDESAGLHSHRYLGIKGLGIDLVIPGTASRDSAALLLHGYLSLKEPVYQGSISFELPKAKIFGGASMMYDIRHPAWIVRADLELPKPMPLGATSLGVYSFSGLFGLRYIASKEAISPPLASDASWGDYYRALQPQRGVWPQKLMTPDRTAGSNSPFSAGAGVGLCTLSNGGKTFSSQLFLLVSLPNLIMLEGRADILAKKRVGPNDDPPYYAYLAISPESLELGAGAHYLIPKATGAVLKLDAVFEAAFFFHNSAAWYLHFGTKAKPVTARILSLFDGYAYLMLSAAGMEAGAGVHYDFNKRYGPIGVSAHAYLDLWAHVSFERFQAGGGVALGGSVDVRVFRFSLYFGLAAALTVEAPQPFRIAGSVQICVKVKLVKTFSRCCTLDFVWTRDQSVNTTPVDVIAPPLDSPSAIAVHMLSGSTYAVAFSSSPSPNGTPPAIPLDCYIDVKLAKPVDPSAVVGKIGGVTNPPVGHVDVMPPAFGSRIVDHNYALTDVRIEVLSGGVWVPYLPYQALSPGAVLDAQTAAQLADLPLGMWQKQDPSYGQIRFLALTPFSWIGVPGYVVPEEMGLTAKTMYCVARSREERCLSWNAPQEFTTGENYTGTNILYRVDQARAAAVRSTHSRLASVSLAIAPLGLATFRFLEPAVQCRISAFTTAPSIVVRWQRRSSWQPPVLAEDGSPLPWPQLVFEDVGAPLNVSRAELADDIVYDDPDTPIERILIETPGPDAQHIQSVEQQIADATEELVRATPAERDAIQVRIDDLRAELKAAPDGACIHDVDSGEEDRKAAIAKLKATLEGINRKIIEMQAAFDASCKAPTMSPSECEELSQEIEALQTQAKEIKAQIATLHTRLDGIKSKIDALKQTYDESCVITSQRIAAPKHAADAANAAAAAPGLAAPAPTLENWNVPAPSPGTPLSAKECAKLAAAIAALQTQAKELEDEIRVLEAQGEAGKLPSGWPCATFIHELCWLSETDHVYNGTIPGIDAIAADYSAMRTAAEGVIQPIWQPRQAYRIALNVRDTVTNRHTGQTSVHNHAPYYVHFRTEGPIGFFESLSAQDFGIPPNPVNDDRVEAPERTIKFYIDEERSSPDPSGNLLYAKPLYYAKVTLRLFFNRPYAYHFFAEWPNVGAGARRYALNLAIKDPAEAAPLALPPADHEAAHVSATIGGTQDWIADASPRISPEIAAIRAFQHPLAPGEIHSTACLVTGGDPIVPLSKSLQATMQDLEPDKLYTAVVLNQDLDHGRVAEVGAYPFKTSRYRDFAEHIASLRLRDDEGHARLAVFEVSHPLAPAATEAAAVSAALAIVMRTPGPASAAFPDVFDRLVHEQLKLDPLAPALSLEVNFVSNNVTGSVYGLWIRSPEPLFDPRLPAQETAGLMRLLQAGNVRSDVSILFSKDACQAFAMSNGGSLPLANVSLTFANKMWNGQGYDFESATSETFARP